MKFIRLTYPFLIVFSILIFSENLKAQIDTTKAPGDTTSLNLRDQKEKILENSDFDLEDSKLLDYLEKLERNPLDLNIVTQKELESIPYINSIIARRIIEYRKENIYFKSKRELLKVDGITEILYDEIKGYLVARKSKVDVLINENGETEIDSRGSRINLIKNFNFRYRTRFQQELQPKVGYLNGKYPGSRAKIYNQFNSIFKNSNFTLEGNVTIEKDAGETNFADFKSAYLELSDYKFIKELIVGDYSLNFGQGLGMWSSFGFSKGNISVDPIKKKEKGIDSYSSVSEVQFFRGGAAKLNFGNKYNFYVFYSNHFLDASIDTTLGEASTIYFDGYHRTASELSRQNSIKERFLGGRFLYDNDFLRLGVTYWDAKFSKPFEPDTTTAATQLFNFSGDYANMMSADYDFIYRNMNLYGEVARSNNGALAGIGNFQLNFMGIADVVFSYRNYSRDFTVLHSFGFGDRSGNTQNETGFYTGIQLTPLKGLSVNAYYDQFKFPYRTYSDAVPTVGNDFLVFSEWKANSQLMFNFKYRYQNQEGTVSIIDEFNRSVRVLDNRNQLNLRIGFTYQFKNNLRVRSRLEYVYVGYKDFGGDNKGFLFYSDARFVPLPKLTFDARIIFFQTDSYDSRIYEYEDDVRGVMSNTGLYGNGTRWYLLARYKVFNSIELQAKYAETYQDGVKSIGTGYDLINGDINNKFNFGMEIKF
ncbi:MAG TPA: helix-hairpin-helix domain-containing protein [Ignavibacteria bacterium]